MSNYVILGAAGGTGLSIGAELERRGASYRVVGRDSTRLAQLFSRPEAVAADLERPDDARRAMSGMHTAIFAMGLPYWEFAKYPQLMRTVVAAASDAGVKRLVLLAPVYQYGVPQTERVAETHPHQPHTFKGRMRAEQEDIVLAAHGAGTLQTLVVHLPDFYGPGCAGKSFVNGAYEGAIAGKSADWVGPANVPREFYYVPDLGATLLDLMARDEAFGTDWNIGGAGTITGQELLRLGFAAAGHPVRVRIANKLMLRAIGVINPFMRELVEMYYLTQTPVILDDGKLMRLLGQVHKTSYAEGAAATIAAMRAELVSRTEAAVAP